MILIKALSAYRMGATTKVFIKIFAILFTIEMTVMFFLSKYEHLPSSQLVENIVDAMLLSIIAVPIIIALIRRYISHNDELSILLHTSQTISETLDFDVVLQTVIDSATNFLELHTGALYLLEGKDLYLGSTTPGLPPNFPQHLRHGSVDDHPHLKQSIINKAPVALADVSRVNLSPAEQAVVELVIVFASYCQR